MDWIDEKIEKIRDKIRNLPIRKALPAYLCIFALAGFLLTVITVGICGKWQDILYEKSSEIQVVYTANGKRVFGYTQDFLSLSTSRKAAVMILTAVQNWCPYVYAVVSMFITAVLFYRRRLKKPFDILEEGMRNIKEKNLEFKMEYNSRDEMGRLCEAFEEMRGHLVENQKEMWRLVEEQKKLNAAFAHDLRTPLTVIRGYSDFLVKYIPQRNISQEKLKDTLRLLSAQAERLEKFSQTMKDARSVDDIPFHPEKTDCAYLDKKIRGMANALNEAKEIHLSYSVRGCENTMLADENIILEVLDNLLSNAIRYARQEVEIETECDGTMFYLYVADDGPGFSDAALQNAGKAYFSEGENREHFGIGLHIASALCKKHGGEISFANRIGQEGAIVSASFRLSSENLTHV